MKPNVHAFNVELAEMVGLNQAILLQHLFYWHQNNQKKKDHIKDGSVWTYNTLEEISSVFPYLTPRQVSYAFQSLEKKGLILVGNYNHSKMDHTKWYALSKTGLELFEKSNVKSVKSNIQNVKSGEQNVKSTRTDIDQIEEDTTKVVSSDDEQKKKLYWALVERYPKNRAGNRHHTLKNWMQLTQAEMKLAYTNLERYLKIAQPYVKKLSNYIDERCFSEEWLQAEERNKTNKGGKTNPGHNFTGEY